MADWVFIVAALTGGILLGALAVLLMPRRPKREVVAHEVVAEEYPAPSPPPRAPPAAPPRAPAREPDEDVFTYARDELAPRPRIAPRAPTSEPQRVPPPTTPPIPTEWARREPGAAPPDRVKGICSSCGTPISVSRRRPIRVACPVCGRTRLLT